MRPKDKPKPKLKQKTKKLNLRPEVKAKAEARGQKDDAKKVRNEDEAEGTVKLEDWSQSGSSR